MFGFLVGWGVFWLLLWLFVLWIGYTTKDSDWEGAGFLWTAISIAYLIAVFAGRAVM